MCISWTNKEFEDINARYNHEDSQREVQSMYNEQPDIKLVQKYSLPYCVKQIITLNYRI
jgi:hypothetical protein